MAIEFDPVKNVSNIEKHGISLARAADMDVRRTIRDARSEEPRYRLYGYPDDTAHCLEATDRGVMCEG